MNDEDLMKALGRAARAQAPADDRWEALAAGRLSDAEREQLLEDAARSDEAADAYEAFRPLGAEFQARVVQRLSGELARGPAAAPPRSNVVPFPRRVARAIVPLALAASVLVAVGLVFLLRPGGALPPLPGYALSLDGQVQMMRGDPPPATGAPFAAGNHFRLVLTPDRRVEGEVVTRSYLLLDGEPAPFAAPPPRVSADGAVLIEGEVGRDVQLPQGAARLLVIVGRESALPDPRELARRLGAAGHEQSDEWSAWMMPVVGE